MITFDDLQINGKTLDITIPSNTIVYLSQDLDLFSPQYVGHILYKNFPIHNAKKSFLKKVFYEIKHNKTLENNLSPEDNMKMFAEIFNSHCIWNVPLRYFSVSQHTVSVKNIDKETLIQLEVGLAMLSQEKVLLIRDIPQITNTKAKERIKGIFEAKAQYSGEIIIYTGFNLDCESEIKINL
ncbi:MAG: ABC-type transport system involved in cytochrome c biogenesis ATPase subunit [Candidatus Deianiraeaceae bacterium]|jgi:ABC-type transport system involved in cytochrome c biogenesis ATPase subunit